MKFAAPLLSFPFLHKEIASLEAIPMAQHVSCIPSLSLWLGLSLSAQYKAESLWQPENFPFSPQEAAACLRDIAEMGDMALSGVPMEALAVSRPAYDLARDIKEQEDVQAFVAHMVSNKHHTQDGGHDNARVPHLAAGVDIHVLRAAQRFLLMAWYVEERFLEVRELTKGYTKETDSLRQVLGAAQEDDDTALEQLAEMYAMLHDIDVPLPDWRQVLENAAIFFPSECTLLINSHAMAQHVREHCSMQSLPSDVFATAFSLPAPLPHDVALTYCSCSVGDVLRAGTPFDSSITASPLSSPVLMTRPWHTKIIHCLLVEK